MNLDEYIVAQLRSLTSNVYTDMNPARNNYPCIVIDNQYSDPTQAMSESVDFENREYEISIWAETRREAVNLSNQVRELLDNTSATGVININKIIYTGQSSDFIDLTGPIGNKALNESNRLYGINMDFQFWTYI